MIGCIFAKNGPLEGGLESNSSYTICGAKDDFIRFSYLYPYFSNQEPIPFSKAHALSYTHSKVGNGQMHIHHLCTVDFWWVCKRPAGVLMLFSSGFLASTHAISKQLPLYFRKAYALRYGYRKFRNDRMYIGGGGPLEGGHESNSSCTVSGAEGDFR